MKIDLHTHSILSQDGGISEKGYEKLLNTKLDAIAVTDHNTISFAAKLQQKLGDRIIIGEEIASLDGEIIGLFLKKKIPSGLSASETANSIKQQGGVVYIPHPLETVRKGLSQVEMEKLGRLIDIIEVYNGRTFQSGKQKEVLTFAQKVNKAHSAASDAHCTSGAGRTYSVINKKPSAKTLANLLKNGSLVKQHAPFWTYLCPKVNLIKNKLFLSKS